MLSYTKSRNAGKTFLQTLFFFLLVTQICFAQWYQQNSGTTENLYAVHFIDENIGIAVGDSGTILRTTNGGTTWAIQASGTILPLNDICFTDLNNGWAVGEEGTIIRTTTGGVTWLPQTSGITEGLKGVCFIDVNNGWIVGGYGIIRRTTNGGIDWTPQTSGTWMRLNDVCFTDANNGVAVGGENGWVNAQGIILRTTNAGATWTECATGTTHTYFEKIVFIGANIGLTVGEDKHYLLNCDPNILQTTDGGITWDSVLVMHYIAFHNVAFTDANNGWVVGGGGTILRTTNGGIDWAPQTSGTTNSLSGVYLIDALNGWAVGDNGTILHTSNGGVSFVEEEQIDKMPTEFLLSNNFPNPFNPSTKIKYSVPQSSNVTIRVFDILGNEIETIVNEEKPAGTYQVTWYAEELPSGVYFYRLQAGEFISVKKMLLLK